MWIGEKGRHRKEIGTDWWRCSSMPLNESEARFFVVLVLIVRLRVILRIATVLRRLVLVLLGDPRYIYFMPFL